MTCGAPTGGAARFCSSCGTPVVPEGPPTLNAARLVDPTNGRLDLVTARPTDAAAPGGDSQPTVAGLRLNDTSWWGRARNRSVVAVAACGILLGAAVGLAFAGGT
ncbi:MAG TPA: hypothetical protein VGU73_12925, partial [Acidimicrobiia bacterium]|nr:hypothetical protein [Acidimicrobiia bacterium]